MHNNPAAGTTVRKVARGQPAPKLVHHHARHVSCLSQPPRTLSSGKTQLFHSFNSPYYCYEKDMSLSASSIPVGSVTTCRESTSLANEAITMGGRS